MRETPMWRRYLRFLGSDPAGDAREEVEFHLAMRVEELMRGGLTEAEAKLRAEKEFGDVGAVRRELEAMDRRRGRRQERARRWESVAQDVGFALRTVRGSPGYAAIAVLTLAVGVGASTAMFSVLNGVLLRPLPVEEQGELAVLWMEAAGAGSSHIPVMHRDLVAYGERTSAFRGVAGVAYQGALDQVMREGGEAVTLGTTWVTGDLLPLLGVVPVVGRTLLPADDVPGAERVMVIGHDVWQRRFGGSRAVVGRTLEWNGESYRIVGVLPRGFEYPAGAEVWIPVLPAFPGTLDPGASPAEVMVFDLVGRLAAGATVAGASADFGAYLRVADAERPEAMRGMAPRVTPLAEVISGDARPRLWAAAAAVGILLLIACANVANLLLIRGSSRMREMAVRSALGAGRPRLVRQLLTEAGVLAMAGGVLGVLLAGGAVRILTALAPAQLPRREMIALDGTALAFALAATAAAALLAGLLPAVVTAAGDLGGWLRSGARAGGGGSGGRRLRHGLVVGQVALAIVVVVAAGLLMRSFLLLQSVDLGFDRERLLIAELSPPAEAADRARQLAMQEEALDRVAALPGVTSVAMLPRPPFSGQGGWSAMYTGEGQAPEEQMTNPLANFEVVGPEYFGTLGIPLRSGRGFEDGDRAGGTPVAVVSERLAGQTWPGEEPLGKRVKLGPAEGPGEWHTIVGVVGDTRYRELAEPQPTLYLPIAQFAGPLPLTMAVRTTGPPEGMAPLLRSELGAVHPELALVRAAPVSELIAGPLARPRFSAYVTASFAAMTLLLAAVGIYGAISATVGLRTRELGIRMALGATVGEVKRLVLRQGMGLTLWGIGIGSMAALVAGRGLGGLLFGVGPADAATYMAVIALVLTAAAIACYVPARRVTRISAARAVQAD